MDYFGGKLHLGTNVSIYIYASKHTHTCLHYGGIGSSARHVASETKPILSISLGEHPIAVLVVSFSSIFFSFVDSLPPPPPTKFPSLFTALFYSILFYSFPFYFSHLLANFPPSFSFLEVNEGDLLTSLLTNVVVSLNLPTERPKDKRDSFESCKLFRAYDELDHPRQFRSTGFIVRDGKKEPPNQCRRKESFFAIFYSLIIGKSQFGRKKI